MDDTTKDKFGPLLLAYGGPRAEEAIAITQCAHFVAVDKLSRVLMQKILRSRRRQGIPTVGPRLITDDELRAILDDELLLALDTFELPSSLPFHSWRALLAQLLEALRCNLYWRELAPIETTIAHHWSIHIDRGKPAGRQRSRGSDDMLPVIINYVLWYVRTGGVVPWQSDIGN